jgi:hypothetical protein
MYCVLCWLLGQCAPKAHCERRCIVRDCALSVCECIIIIKVIMSYLASSVLLLLITMSLAIGTNALPQSLSDVASAVKQTDNNYYHSDVSYK